jgi:hypothetical protein
MDGRPVSFGTKVIEGMEGPKQSKAFPLCTEHCSKAQSMERGICSTVV